MEKKLPHLAVTIGDPAGIGPEIVLKALVDPVIKQNCQITVIGSRSVLENNYAKLRHICTLADPQSLKILDIPTRAPIILGEGDINSGEASFSYLKEAITRTIAGEFKAIVTAPISKSLWKAAGYDYPGQTEVLASRCGIEKYGMLFVARSPHTGFILKTLLATTHIPLSQVSSALNPELMTLKLDLLLYCLNNDFNIQKPRIVIAGLNPHSGEGGQLGREEIEWLIPWLESERDKRPDIELIGAIPPDTMWIKPGQAWYVDANCGAADAYIALYHDQGLIPVKLMAFAQAINTTIGLPFLRTSPDHGTAFDIAGKGVADASSMKEAIQLAIQLRSQ